MPAFCHEALARCLAPRMCNTLRPMTFELNDVHSQLNRTTVARIERPRTLARIALGHRRCTLVAGLRISVAGGRHAMGGQQFADGSVHVDTTGLDARARQRTPERGLLHIEAGADWPKIIAASHRMTSAGGCRLGDSAEADRRRCGDARRLDIRQRAWPRPADAADRRRHRGPDAGRCRRRGASSAAATRNAELFSLVIGGYGLFGVIYSATLRLAPRQRVKRVVDIIDLDDAMNAVFRRVDEGCVYGDFQFVIDADRRQLPAPRRVRLLQAGGDRRSRDPMPPPTWHPTPG